MIETLIVDDEQNVGLALKYMLEKYDYRCTTALNTAEARVRLEERSFELVLLDIIMPGESGLDLLEHLQAAHPDTAVVMISTIDDPRVAAKALDLGAFGYLPKPFDANQVLINLANAVRRRDLEIENRAQRQKLAELVRERTAALIASETRHQALLGALPDPVIAYDPEGRATFVNEAFEKTFGWSGEEVLGRRIDFVPPEEMDKTRDAWARLLREGDSTLETRRLTRDGRVLDVHIRGAATRDADGQMTESVVVIRDVTDRQRALEAVRREKEFREAVLNALSDAISIINVDDLTIAWANQAFFEEVGRSAAEVIGRPCYEVTHGLSRPCQPPADPCPLAVTVKSGCRSTDEHVHFRSDGERYYADISTNPLGDETGRVTRVVHVARDVTDRKRAEQALRESEQRFRTLFDNMRSGVAVYESAPDGRDFIFTDLNRAGERISRVKKTDVLGQAVRKAFPGVEALGLWDVLQRVNGTGLPEHHPAGRYQDGRLTQWVENYVFKLPSGEVVAVYDDVTEEKLAEAQIRAEQERFQTLTDQSPLGVSLIRADGSYAYVNPAFTRIFGYTLADVPDGRTWYRLAFPDPDERRAEIADWKRDIAVQGEGPVITKTSTVRCKDGSTKVVHFRVVKLEAGDHLVLFEDISERKAAEEALRESEDQYRTLVEALPTGFIQADERTELLYLNDRLAEMLGYAPDELKGRQTLDFLDEANRLVLLHQVELRKKGSVQPYELVWTKKDGRRVFTMMYPNPIFDRDGQYRGSFALIADISDRKILESQLLQAQKLESIGQLAAGIAHEINTPTQYVTDNTRFLEEAFADLQTALDKYAAVWREMKGGARPADLEADLAATLEKADVEYLTAEIPRAVSQSLEGLGRIGEIVRSMKEFAHPGPDTKAPLDLNQAILSTITVARNEWKYVADLETDLDPDLPSVPCVAGEINQVVLNLIVNAAQAIAEAADESSGEKGRILVGTRADGDWAEIRIADTGPGIPPNIRERVFDPFFTTKDPGKGTGQGLAIAYRVITDKHGGAITLTSEENHGTTFVIRLPLTTNRSEKAS